MAYTPTVYTSDASSPDIDATNLNKSENGIKDAHLMAQVVDSSSRVCEITGDGIPLIPDNAAGTTYLQDAFATVDSWTATGGTASVSGGVLLMTYSGSSGKIERAFTSFSAKMLRARVKANITGTVNMYGTVGGVADTLINSTSVTAGVWALIGAYVSGAVTNVYFSITSPESGNIIYVDWVYIGTGVYDKAIGDRSGNTNNLTNYSIRPTDGKYGKDMSFNGSSSYAQATSPVIGVTFTIAIRVKRSLIGTNQIIYDNSKTAYADGIALFFLADNSVSLRYGNGTGYNSVLIKASETDTTNYHTIIIRVSGTAISWAYDGVFSSSTLSNVLLPGTSNLTIGRLASSVLYFLNGSISHYRLDGRTWSDDEARAWYLNPVSIDSRI